MAAERRGDGGLRRPPRQANNPLAALAFITAFPAVLLFGAWRFADSRDDSAPPAPDAEAVLPAVTPRTPLLSARRTPAVLARETSAAAFEEALRPLGGAVLPGSCAGVAVDGVTALSDGIDTPVTPASTMKFIVAAVALEVLGADHTYTTEVRAEIAADGSIGSLYLVGGGDPLLASDWYPDDATYNRFPQQPATSLDALADAVKAAGVVQVSGNVVADLTRYDSEYYPPTWEIALRNVEGGPISSLTVNDGWVRGDSGKVTDPGAGAAREFYRLLAERGIVIGGQPATGATPTGLATLATVSSAPLVDVVAEMLQNSDNNTAEMMLKEIGFVARGSGSRASGLAVVNEKLTAWGVPMTGVVLDDGSGLSRNNKVTCEAFLAVLDRFDIGDPVVSTLAVAGRSGTLAQYFVGTPVEGRLFGKTGSLNGVKALIGYVEAPGGSTITFALLLQSPGVDEASSFRPVWEGPLASALGSYPAGPTADLVAPLTATPS